MESTINELFDSKNRKFEIPSYQRPYSWGERQIEQFIDDLKNCESQYYLGHFLFERKDDYTLYVIDGQQRLTTSIIFFSCVLNELYFRKEQNELITIDLQDITDYYLKDLRKGTQKFKTVKDDNNFFLEEIIEFNKDHSQEANSSSKVRIRAAKKIFQSELRQTSTFEIERWCKLIENATITEYVVKNKIQSTQIFAFQNDRGKKLTNLEVIKAFFMLQIYLSGNSNEKIDEDISYIESEMSLIYSQIVRIKIDEDEVLNYYWRAVSGKGFYSGDIIRGVKDKIVANVSADKIIWIKHFVSGLSKAFVTVEKIENSSNSYIRDLIYLNNMALSYPFLIKAFKINASEKSINKLSHLLENITFRYLLRGGRAEIESRLNQYLINIKSEESIHSNIVEIVDKLKADNWWGYWNDYSMNFYLNGYFYQNRVDNYFLWKYELYLSDKNHPLPHNVTLNDLILNENIEHIAPKVPTNGVPLANGYGKYNDLENPIEGIETGNWLNKLGNLMLISKKHNTSIGNKSFKHKLDSYGNDNLLNQQKQIAELIEDKNNPVWDKNMIERRQKIMVEAAKNIWSLDAILS